MRKFYDFFFKGGLPIFRNIHIKTALLFFVLLSFSIQNSTAQGPGAQWEFSRVVTLAELGTPMADFQIKIELNGAGQHLHMKADGSDLRFYDGATPLKYWIEKWAPDGKSIIWVKVPAMNTSAIMMYYGNAAALSESYGHDVFEFFDGFDGSTLDSKWEKSQLGGGDIIVSGGEVQLRNKGVTGSRLAIAANLGVSPTIGRYLLETKHKETQYLRNRFYATQNTALNSLNQDENSPVAEYGYFDNMVSWNYNDYAPLTINTDYLTTWDIINGAGFYTWSTLQYNGGNLISLNTFTQWNDLPIKAISIAITETSISSSFVDWVRVRKPGTQPTITFQPEVQTELTVTGFNSGCAGSTITIYGTGFTGVTGVAFNGVALPAASFTVKDGSNIEAVVPIGFTSGPITVTKGATSKNSTIFTAVAPPTQYTITGGGAYCFEGSGVPIGLSNSQSDVTYQLFIGSTLKGTMPGNGSPITFGNQTEAGTYTIMAKKDVTVCSIGMTGSVTVSITSIKLYTVLVTNDGKYCDGTPAPSVTLNGSETGVNYQLYRDGSILVGASKPGTGAALDFGPQAVAGTYTVTASTSTPAVCAKQMTGPVTIIKNALPTVTLSPINSTLCYGGSVNLTASPATPAYGNYAFKINGNTIANGDGSSNIFTLTRLNAVAGNNNVTVTVVDNNGCSNLPITPVVVKAVPEITGDIVSSANGLSNGTAKSITACAGSSIAFAFDDPKPNYTYKFMLAGNPVAINPDFTKSYFTYTPLSNEEQISVIVTNADGCDSTFGPITVNLNPLPEATIGISASAVCKDGLQQTITFIGIGGQAPYTFSYTINGAAQTVTSPGLTSVATVTFTPSAPGTFNYNLISVQESSATTCMKSISGQVATIVVNPLPEATISGTTTVCQGVSNPLITFTGSNGTAPYTFAYKINGGADQAVTTLAGNSVTVEAPTGLAGAFLYSLVSVKDASSTTCSHSQTGSATVTVNPTPTATISGNATICQTTGSAVVTFTNSQTLPVTITYTINGVSAPTVNVAANNATTTVPVVTTTGGTFDYEIISVAYQSGPICSTPVTGQKATVTINPTPTATISGDTTVCLGTTPLPVITFTNPQSLKVIITYKINSGANQTIPVGASTTNTVNAPTGASGTFDYTLVSVAYENNPLCPTTIIGTAKVIVNPKPTATISGAITICQNSPADPAITFTGANGTAPYTFYYSINGGATVSVQTIAGNSITVPQPTGTPGTFTYILLNVVDASTSTCANTASGTAVIKVNPLPTATISSSISYVCMNDASLPVITFTGVGGTSNYTFTYTINGGALQTVVSTGNTATVTVPTNVANTFVYNLISVKDASSTTCENKQTGSVTVIIKELPVIILTGSQTICQGVQNDPYSTAFGNGISNYVWTFIGGTKVSGGTSTDPEIVINWANVPGPKSITVNYTENGCSAAAPATVAATTSTVTPTFINPITEVCIGPSGIVYTTEAGSNNNYVWTVSAGGTIISTTNNTATVTWLGSGLQTIGLNYSNEDNCTASSPTIQNVTVYPATIGGTLSIDQTKCERSTPSTITLSGNVGTVVRWEKSTVANFASGGTTILNTTTTLNGAEVGTVTVTTYIRAWVKSGTCSEVASSTHTITVNPTSVAGTIDRPQTICSGSNSGVLTLSGHTGSVVRWESSPDGLAPWTTIINTNTTYTYPNLTATTHYRAVVQSGLCFEIASVAIIITVNPTTVGGTLNADQTICEGSLPIAFTLSGQVGAVIQWEISTESTFKPANTTIISNTSSTLSGVEIGILTATSYVRAMVQSGVCSVAYPVFRTITVNPTSVGGTIDGPKTICSGANSGLLTLSRHTGTILRWESSTTGAAPWTTIVNTGTTFTSPNLTTTTHYRAFVQSGTCTEKYSEIAIITVDPATVGGTLSADQTICQGSIPAVITLTGQIGDILKWEISTESTFQAVNTTTISNTTTTLTGTEIGPLTATRYVRAMVQSGVCSFANSVVRTITVNPTTVGGVVSGTKTICSGTNSGILTLSGNTGTVVRWESSTTGVAPWTPIAHTGTTFTSPNLTTTTHYRAVVQSGNCLEMPSGATMITVDPPTVGGTVGSPATVCSGNNTGTLTLTGNAGSVVRWEFSINGTSWESLPSNTTISYIYTNITATTYYRAVVKSGACGEIFSASAKITVEPAPTVNAGTGFFVCANAGFVNVGTTAIANNYSGLNWSGGTGTWTNQNDLTAATYNPSKADSIAQKLILTLTVNGLGSCSANTATDTIHLTIQPYPQIVVISPASAETCVGTIIPLTSVKTGVQFDSRSATQSPVVAIPDNNPGGVYSTIKFNDIPVNAVIDSMEVKYTIDHPVDADLNINLKAPNGSVLNLAHALTGVNYTNTIISSTSTKPIQTFGTAPYNAEEYAPKAQVGIRGASSVPGLNTPFIKSFSDLYSKPNGDWIFSVRDGGSGANSIGTFQTWNLAIYYHIPVDSVPVAWSPLSNLYTNAAATIAYDGSPRSIVYAKPVSGGSFTYTATNINTVGCTSFKTVNIVVNAAPVININTDYCTVPNRVTLVATPAATSYSWSTGGNTQSVLADVAGTYYVSTTNAAGCVATAEIDIAQELVINGDFEQGNFGFQTPPLDLDPSKFYTFSGSGANALNTEGLYGIGTNGQEYHQDFWGRDHTSGEGKFMIVNGYPGAQPIVWQQTVSVKPNTTYYFSAWGISLNDVHVVASLQFNVNKKQVGNIATLPVGISNNTNPWRPEGRFYGNWTSDDTTTVAVISITDLQTSPGGNDFGLDDISFATLSPFVTYNGEAGLENQTICLGDSIKPISYIVGTGLSGPELIIEPGNNNLQGYYDGRNFVIKGKPTATGIYNYEVYSTCGGVRKLGAKGTITIKPNSTISLLPEGGTANQNLCVSSAIEDIKFSVINGTDGVVTGLPTGVTYNYAGGILSIFGTPSVSGTFDYKSKTVGSCYADSLSGTLIISPKPGGGLLTSQTICIGEPATLTLSGYSGEIVGWEYSNDGFVTTLNTLPGVETAKTFTEINQSTSYRVVIKNNGSCPNAYSTVGKISVKNMWEGKYDNDWSFDLNWSTSIKPVINVAICADTVTIPKGISYNPIVTTTEAVKHLNITPTGKLTINGIGNLKIAGNLKNQGIFDVKNGKVEFNGTSGIQTIKGSDFTTNTVKDLVVSNQTGLTISFTPLDTLNITGELSFGNTTAKLNTGDNITLKSSKNATANVGIVASGNTVAGNFVVERFINTGLTANGGHKKSWQLLAIPTTGQSIKDSWMEGATATNVNSTPGSTGNLRPGYGTMITSAVRGAGTQPTPGFDVFTAPGPSMKSYNPVTKDYDAGPASTALPIYNPKGYLVLVRGDRSVYTSNGDATPTILRTKGKLITGNTPILTFQPNTWNSVGNPYASAIDLKKIEKGGSVVKNIYAVWDPLSTGGYGLGAYTYLSESNGVFEATPPSASYPDKQTIYIQSGQAFLVQTAPLEGGSIVFTEIAKIGGSNMVMRPFGTDSRVQQLRTNLYGLNADGSAFISDGTLNQFGEDYSNEIDGLDARKMSNTSENLSLKSNAKLLAIERRQPIMENDTIFYNLSGLQVQKYRFDFIAKGLQEDGLQGFLEDLYVGSRTLLNMEGSTLYDFAIENKPGSYASDRFRIVFKTAFSPLPVTFVGIKANQTGEDILVTWNVENEIGVIGYDVEKSIDGITFHKVIHVPAKNIKEYNWLDKNAESGYNYYRLNAMNQNGKTELSNVAKVSIQLEPSKITVYPNPITNGVVNVHLVNQPSGKYKIRLLNPVGQVMINKIVTHVQGNSIHPLKWDYKMARGMYQIEVTKPDGGVNLIKVVY